MVSRPAGSEARVGRTTGPRRATAVVVMLLAACAPSGTPPKTLGPEDRAASVAPLDGPYAIAVRGTRRQATPAPPPPMTCAPGANVHTVDTGGVKLVAFGFDDGPWPDTTAAIMTQFERRGMRATFFMIGAHLVKYPDIGRSVVARGHEVGNHTLSHPYTQAGILGEIAPAADLIAAITGAFPRLFRSPGLTTGAQLRDGLAFFSMCNILTSISTGDAASPRPSAATICERFRNQLHPGGIVLAHDGGGNHDTTAAAVPCMLDYATQQGYRVVTISELLGQSVVSGFGR